jgi:xylulokinase
LICFRQHRKQLYDEAWKILLPLDFIQRRLCGAFVTDHTMASGTMFYDVGTQYWAADLLAQNGLSAEKLPDIAWAGSVIGTILPNVADELGLRHDVLIVNGAQDQKCAAIAAGAARNIAAISLGTGSCLAQISALPVRDPEMRIPFFSYARQSEWDLEGVVSTAGSAYRWFQKELANGQSFSVLDDSAAHVGLPNSVLFFPYLSGVSSPNWSEGSGTFTGLSRSSTIGHMARAVLEGVAYNIRENLEVMADVCGSAQELRLYGGGSKSPLWCQIIANVTGKRVVRLISSETALAGAAILAFQPLAVNAPACLPCADSFLPHAEEIALYDASYRRYEAIRQKFFGV